jgi:hypothetical protein
VIVFVLVDDWYQLEKKSTKRNAPGAKPEMSDSEIMTLALMMDYLPFPGETQQQQASSDLKRLVGRVRQRIEGVFR